jgi:hypothetical protein
VWNLGEAFLDKASTLYAQLKARMLRPYKNRDSFPEITKEGLEQLAKPKGYSVFTPNDATT